SMHCLSMDTQPPFLLWCERTLRKKGAERLTGAICILELMVCSRCVGHQSSEKMARNPADERFRGLDFAHSPEMLRMFNNIFGLHEFRVNQLEAINATILKENVFVVGGNGAGKSLCYQLPACLSAGVTVVISPLNVLPLYLTLWGDHDYTDAENIYEQLSENDPMIKLLYVTPEKLAADWLQLYWSMIESIDLVCLCSWGDDFRPDYGTLNELQQDFQGVPMIAVSGPIGPHIQEDILKKLQMTNPQVFTMSFNRTNLKYAVPTRTTMYGEMDCITWIKEHYPRDSGIVYCWRRVVCEYMADSLNEAGLLACSYHAGMPNRDRESAQNKWKENECQVICATVAFGMGIHKPDVRYVIHTFLPKSMEQYHRESGRAGRDGNMSHCILFYSDSDHGVLERDGELVKLEPMVEYCLKKKDCRRIQLLTYFGGVDTEANLCKKNTETICDNCERDNVSKQLCFNLTSSTKPVCRCQY
uniref:ATP-dependent DNA helicase n=1 Tax=Gadus morhua TaxID=8049 RepID=A0A8C4ZDB0_GADMO